MGKNNKQPLSDHCDGQKFFNPGGGKDHSFKDFLKIAREIQSAPWPKWVELQEQKPPQRRVITGLQYSVINHSTVLLQTQGLNILTDPVYSERVSPVTFAGPKRVHRPGISFENLPPINVVLVSHNHYDHLDLATLIRLREKFDPLILTSLGNHKFFMKKGFKKVEEFDWWQTHSFSGSTQATKFHFVPAQHFSSRGLHDRNKTLWGGFVIETPGSKIYFGGDTGYGDFFKQIYTRFGSMSLSFIPIGAYEPRWFMKPVHMNPQDAVLAHRDLNSQLSVGIHYGCFKLTSEAIHDPVIHLRKALDLYAITPERFITVDFGKIYQLSV